MSYMASIQLDAFRVHMSEIHQPIQLVISQSHFSDLNTILVPHSISVHGYFYYLDSVSSKIMDSLISLSKHILLSSKFIHLSISYINSSTS